MFGDLTRFGVYSGPQHATFEDCLGLWGRCEELGYDWLSVFDHFMPIVGDPMGRASRRPRCWRRWRRRPRAFASRSW